MSTPVRAKAVAASTFILVGWTDPKPYLRKLTRYDFHRPEDRGEVRLVAWAADPHPGETIAPKVDRHRGFRLVVAHLRYDATPEVSGDPPTSNVSPPPAEAARP